MNEISNSNYLNGISLESVIVILIAISNGNQ